MLFLHNEMHSTLTVVSEKRGGFQHLNQSIKFFISKQKTVSVYYSTFLDSNSN